MNIEKIFTREVIVETLKRLPPITSPLIDGIYKTKKQHPFTIIGIDEIKKIINNVPVIKRGSAAYRLDSGSTEVSFIEPQPIEIEDFVSAKDVNDMKMFKPEDDKVWIDNRISDLRLNVRTTCEAMAAQSLLGKITYPMKMDSGYGDYTVTFGTPLTETCSKKWDVTTTKLSDILDLLIRMQDAIKKKSVFGGQIVIKAGSKAFLKLADHVMNMTNDNRVNATVTEANIIFAGFRVELHSQTYYNLKTKETVSQVNDNKIVMIATDAPHTLFYTAIDDIEAKLQALPLWITTELSKNPSGMKIFGKSKPLPIPVVNAICWSEVVF